ncbi:MAG: B-box zinc finger protein [Candidatus Acidiferrales bacterium]
MKCAVHPEVDATAFCRNCGKALCPECTRTIQGMHYCEPCLAALVTHLPAPPAKEHLPVAAFFLGLIPGLGAVYNGEYSKAMLHVAIFVGLVTLDSTGMHQPLFGLLTGFFCLYMPVEACITATHLRDSEIQASAAAPAIAPPTAATPGAETQTPGMMPLPAPAPAPPVARVRRPHLIGPVVLILIGAIFLADNLGWMDADRLLAHGWPLILIALGLYQISKKRH